MLGPLPKQGTIHIGSRHAKPNDEVLSHWYLCVRRRFDFLDCATEWIPDTFPEESKGGNESCQLGRMCV